MTNQQTGAARPDGSRATGFARIRLGEQLRVNNDVTVIALYAITSLLVGIGLIMVLSSSSITSYLDDEGFFGRFWRQATFALLGVPLMLLAAAMPIRFWKRGAWWFFGLGLGLQLLVFTPLGEEGGGNRNWIRIGSVTAQPSEFLKLALIVWLGAMLLKNDRRLGTWRGDLLPYTLGIAVALGSVMAGKDMGTAMMMAGASLGALYFGGIRLRTLGAIVGAAMFAVLAFLLSSENRMNRLFGFFGGHVDYSGLGWQPLHGRWALAAGGPFGAGLGNSKAKWSWLPAADNDYIFAIIGEELGLIGALLVIVLYLALAAFMMRAISRARDRFGKAVIGGILVWIVGQAFVNIGVVIGVLPVLGVPLPLISSGGTALIACLLAIGVVISIARDGEAYQASLARGESE